MSIKEQISILKGDNRLISVMPLVKSDRSIRQLLLVEDLYKEIYEEKEEIVDVETFANLIADLEVFVTSETIDPNYLWCLKPKKNGVWEIKSKRPCPQIRIFGVFADKDIFIGTHLESRDDLGSIGSQQWKIAIRTTISIWDKLFPGFTHKKTSDVKNLITGALDGQYFK